MHKKVILLTETISPYRIPVFNEIAMALREQFRVIFLSESEKRRQWKIYKEKIKFQYEVLSNILLQRKGSTPYFLNPTILFRLMAHSPDIIICSGYYQPSSFLTLLYAKLFKKYIILWFESNRHEERPNSFARESYKRWFIRNCSAYIVPGKASFEYLIALGAKSEMIQIAPNAVDNGYFSKMADEYRESKEIFKQTKRYPKKLILYVGLLIERKGISDLLKAFKVFSQELPEIGLLLIGNGEKKEQYKDFCKTNNIKNVFFEGFIHQEELPKYYAASDIFVFPVHSDPWGLVLNEAMACQLPVISSNAAGAAYDLIKNGENGYIYEKGNIKELVETVKKVLNSGCISMGAKSYETIQNFSSQKCALGFLEAIRQQNNLR